MGIDSCNAVHVFSTCHHQFVIDHVLGDITQAQKGATHVEFAGNTCPHVDIVSNTLHLGRVDEVARTNGLTHQIVVIFAGGYFEAQLFCDVHQLRTDFSHFTQRFELKVMLSAPFGAEVMLLPLLKDV